MSNVGITLKKEITKEIISSVNFKIRVPSGETDYGVYAEAVAYGIRDGMLYLTYAMDSLNIKMLHALRHSIKVLWIDILDDKGVKIHTYNFSIKYNSFAIDNEKYQDQLHVKYVFEITG
jgi:hypothetical protein